MKTEVKKQEKTPEEKLIDRKQTNAAFLLIFPTLILAAIAVFYAPLAISLVTILLAFYQFLMMKKFIEDYYHK